MCWSPGLVAVGVVVDALAQQAQLPPRLGFAQAHVGRQRVGHARQVVAVGADQRPGAEAAAAGWRSISRLVHTRGSKSNAGLQRRVLRDVGRPCGGRSSAPARPAASNCSSAAWLRCIDRSHTSTSSPAAGRHLLQQVDLALQPGHQRGRLGCARRHCSTAHRPSASPLQTSKRRIGPRARRASANLGPGRRLTRVPGGSVPGLRPERRCRGRSSRRRRSRFRPRPASRPAPSLPASPESMSAMASAKLSKGPTSCGRRAPASSSRRAAQDALAPGRWYPAFPHRVPALRPASSQAHV